MPGTIDASRSKIIGMPGSAASVAPFLQRLSGLSAGQKAAAVNLGIFPEMTGTAYAYAAPASVGTAGDRLAGIDAYLAPPAAAAQAVQVAYAPPPTPTTVQKTSVPFQPKIWLQLASGPDVDALTSRFQRMKRENPDLFAGIKPYVARSADSARLLVGPFRGTSDAQIFGDDLKTIGVDAFRFTNSQTDRIAPLATE